MDGESERKKIEDKLNCISGIYSRAGIYISMEVREKTNIFILLVAVIYLKYSKTNLKEILKKSAIQDQFTGSIPPEGKNGWGYGKLNAYQAIIELIKLSGTHDSTIKSSEKDLILYPNPTDNYTFLFIDNIQASDIPAIKVFNAGGQLMPTDHLNTESNNLIRLISKAGSQESTLYMLVCITQTRC